MNELSIVDVRRAACVSNGIPRRCMGPEGAPPPGVRHTGLVAAALAGATPGWPRTRHASASGAKRSSLTTGASLLEHPLSNLLRASLPCQQDGPDGSTIWLVVYHNARPHQAPGRKTRSEKRGENLKQYMTMPT